MSVLKDVPQGDIVKACNAVACAFNRLAPLFNLQPRDEQVLTDYLMDTLSAILDRLPEDKT